MSEPEVPPVEKGGGRGRPLRVRPQNRTVYVPDRDLPLYDTFLTMMKRDGQSFWEGIREYVGREVEKRKPGNPQRPLEAFPGAKALSCEHDWVLDRKNYVPPIFVCAKRCSAWQAVK